MNFLRLYLLKLFNGATSNFQLKMLIGFANLFLRSDKRLSAKNVKFLDLAILNRKVIAPEVLTKTHRPNYANSTVNVIEINCPEVQILELENFIISGSSSSFIKNNELYIERFCNEKNENANYNSGSVLSVNEKFGVVRKGELRYVDNGFFLAGNGSWNYYHWLIEILPKLQVYLALGLHKLGVKLLVPDNIKNNANLKFLLNSVLGDEKVCIVFIPCDFSTHVKFLLHLTPINNLLYNEREVGLAENILHLKYNSLSFISSRIERSISLSDHEILSADRIFLGRKKGTVRGYNQSEIIPLLLKHDFKILYMEDYDVKQQIGFFKNAKYIVGASGAAWTNLIFCTDSCKGLTWLPESAKNFSVFSTLADFANVQLSFFKLESSNSKSIHANYIIDLTFFEMQLHQLLGHNK